MPTYLGPIFGTGKHGAKVSSANEDINSVRQSCSVSLNSNQVTVTNGASFAVGDLVFVHKSRGLTNIGRHYFARILSIASNVLTLDRVAPYAFADSGADQSQIVVVKEYTSWKINAGVTVAPADWNGETGGICVALVQGKFTNLGDLNGTGKGYRGGTQATGNTGEQGEGTAGAPSRTTSRNGTGAGGGSNTDSDGPGNSGAGGAYKTDASAGPRHFEFSLDGGPACEGGQAFGDDVFDQIIFGGAGSAGGRDNIGSNNNGNGGDSGSILIVFAGEIDNSAGTITNNGANGGYNSNNHNGGGGGGSGGATWIRSRKITGADRIYVNAGTGAWGCDTQHSNLATNGTKGRIRIESAKVTGTNADATIVSTSLPFMGSIGPIA